MTPTPQAIVQAIQEELDEMEAYGGIPKRICLHPDTFDAIQPIWIDVGAYWDLIRGMDDMKFGYFRIEQ